MTQDPHGESTPDWLRARALSTPDRLGLIAVGERLTFGELDAAVETTCVALAAAHPGLKSGAWDLKSSAQRPVVALLAGNSAAFVKAIHAVARLNAVLLPLNVRLTPDELAFQVHNASAAVVIADAPRLATAQTLAAPAVSLEQLTQSRAAPRRYEPPPFALSQTMTLIYTSGTTGKPKPAMLTFNNHLASAKASALNLGTGESDRWLAALPLFHIGGLAILLRSVLDGFTAEVHEGFDPARANAAIDDGVTVISVVANMLQRMLDERGERPYPPHLRCVLLGGGPAPRSLLEACAARGVPVVQTYGLTETASQLTTLAPADALRKLGSAGKPLAGNRLRILDDERECAPGQPGEIVVHGPTVTAGYLNLPEATAHALRDGWLHTGDLGYLDDEGFLYVLDRRDDLIVSGGENVYPAEIESALQSHPAVLEAGVTGVPDQRWGRVAHAFVVLRPGATATADELLAYCTVRLAPYKLPRVITFAAALPRNAAGKLVRHELRP